LKLYSTAHDGLGYFGLGLLGFRAQAEAVTSLIGTDVNFVELFKKSFTLYVESGMRKRTEADIDILINEQGGCPDFKADFCKIIIEHYLRKIHCFYLHLTHLTVFLPKYSPPWGSSF
jgi:hypothetical protein